MATNDLGSANNHLDNLFPEVEDDIFLRNSQKFAKANDEMDKKRCMSTTRQDIDKKRRQFEQHALDSTERCLGLLSEAEEVGAGTAVELTRQHEQLQKTYVHLDETNSTLRTSQRYLTGLKSCIGGLKNYFSRNNSIIPARDSNASQMAKPSTNAEIVSMTSKKLCDNPPLSRIVNDRSASQHRPIQREENDFESRLESNLGNMLDSVTRLKVLATDMGTEIELHNDLIDKINDKIEDVDTIMTKQNKQITLLLKK
ncbi:soluble NSF attachment protein 29-like [Scaptodrosophila lebanonensis]|uniref:Soluble NSF attachment protein 29-like n=1 Tax=Drosophila lebanonensis TaxID=7225 RepID=A0A6J2TK70_DROLE|nr:soluble NSF attachment protein 29-like [Scaptodrosophila lebanonensis]